MSLYPSLEDMKVDHLSKAQDAYVEHITNSSQVDQSQLPYPLMNRSTAPNEMSSLYPELNSYMGMELSDDVIAQNMPEYSVARTQPNAIAMQCYGGMVAPLSGQSLGLQRAHITHGIRELTVCKDGSGKVGVRVQAINNGVFVSLVTKDSPAALAGLRFGDQILEINGSVVAGFSMDQVHALFRKCEVNGISVVVRDRPFERTVTLHKDSAGHVGFQFKGGKVVGLVKDSSAARNGLLTEHHLLEVNGQNVAGLKDKDITSLIEGAGDIVTVTVIPTFIYTHMVKSMNPGLLKGFMDHSVPL